MSVSVWSTLGAPVCCNSPKTCNWEIKYPNLPWLCLLFLGQFDLQHNRRVKQIGTSCSEQFMGWVVESWEFTRHFPHLTDCRLKSLGLFKRQNFVCNTLRCGSAQHTFTFPPSSKPLYTLLHHVTTAEFGLVDSLDPCPLCDSLSMQPHGNLLFDRTKASWAMWCLDSWGLLRSIFQLSVGEKEWLQAEFTPDLIKQRWLPQKSRNTARASLIKTPEMWVNKTVCQPLSMVLS